MRTRTSRLPALLVGLVFVLSAVPQALRAEKIKLKDGTEFSGKLLGKDGEHVAVMFPRADVVSIDGQLLPPAIAQGTPAPDFEVTDLSGATQKLSSYQGKVALVQFWATWCPHCRSDLSMVKDLHARYQKLGLQVLAVSVDEDLTKLQAFVKQEGILYPVVAARAQPAATASLSDLYETNGVPAYFLIDTRGVIAETFHGSVTEGKVDLEGKVKQLLPPARTAAFSSPTGS